MKNIYLVRRNPKAAKTEGDWIQMDRADFTKFIKSDAAAGRYFARLPRDDDEQPNIIYEVSESEYKRYRTEKRHHQHLMDGMTEMQVQIISYNALISGQDGKTEEFLSDDTDFVDSLLMQLDIEKLQDALDELDIFDQILIQDLIMSATGKTERQLSRKTDIPQKTINNRKKKALALLKKYFE